MSFSQTMERLPQEIHNQIFCHLKSQDKFTCLRVSNNWNKWVMPFIYGNFEIKSGGKLLKAVGHFKKYPNVAYLVETLTIEDCIDKETLLSLLETTTRLSRLAVDDIKFTKNELETLHGQLPNLKSLKLTKLDFTKEKLSDSIAVPVQFTDLDVKFRHYTDTDHCAHKGVIALTDYISRKYRGLSSFSFSIATGIVYPVDEDAIEQNTLSLLANCPQLKSYKHILCPITPSFMQAMDTFRIQLDNITIYVSKQTATEQLHALVNSRQIQSIKNVSLITFNDLLTYDPFDDSIQMQVFENLAQIKNLTDLTFGAYHNNTFCVTSLIHCLNYMPWLVNVSVLDMRPITYDIPPITTTLQLKRLKIDTVWMHSSHDLEPTNATMNVLLQNSPHLEEVMFKAQIFFEWSDTLPEKQPTSVLDFRKQTKLKSIVLDMGHDSSEYYLIQDSLGRSKYYYFNTSRNYVIQSTFVPKHRYYTTILLARPAAITFCSYLQGQVNPIRPILYIP